MINDGSLLFRLFASVPFSSELTPQVTGNPKKKTGNQIKVFLPLTSFVGFSSSLNVFQKDLM